MTEGPGSDTPELDKQHEIIQSGKAQVIQEFIEWMFDERSYELCEFNEFEGFHVPAWSGDRERLMAEYFGIDLNKIESERRWLLNRLQLES